MRKKLLFVALTFLSILSLAIGLTACRTGGDSGKSAYELYKDNYIQLNGSEAGMLNENDWLLSLKGDTGSNGLNGENGENGKSAYELYVEAYIKANGSEEGVLSETDWLLSLKGETGNQGENGENGKSAYELYVEAYIKATGSEEGILSEEKWLESLRGETGSKGDDGRSIKNVEIICGDIIIYFDDDTSDTLENKLPDAGHNWNSGVITTNPTCISPGIITYTCDDCGATKKELLDADGSHKWGDYEYDNDYHWHTCKLCGEVEKHEHDFGDASKDSDVNELLECECGIHKTVGEFYSYKVTFECGDGVSVRIYDTQNYDNGGYDSDIAYSRDSDTGELLNNGDGQVNFEVVVALGYRLDKITITSGYKNLKDSIDTGRENTYRITKITDNLIVTVESEIDFLNLPVMVINTENSAPILDKENYVTCSVSVLNAEEHCFEDQTAGIRLRGNSTINYPKKPYRIKFDKKQGLFGWTANKSWVLLAMYQDFSNVKDYAAFALANSILRQDSAFVPNAKHVEVYLNGEYLGLYLLTDQVQENEGRTGVEADFTENDTEVPFLVEWDEYAPNEGVEDIDWFKIYNEDSGVTSYYTIKYPESDQRYNQAQFDYIKNYINAVNSLCHNNKVTKEQFDEYIDLYAFIDYYLIQEVMGQGEINWKSIFMSKSTDGKLVMGPVWDFDWAAGGPMSWDGGIGFANANENSGWSSNSNWFAFMLKVDWFKEVTLNRWKDIKTTLQQSIAQLVVYKDYITEASVRNALIWDFDVDNSILDFSEYYDWVLEYLGNRIDVITELLDA